MARPHKISLCNCQRLGSRNEEGVNDRDQFVFCMKRFPAATPPAPATEFLFLPLRRIVLYANLCLYPLPQTKRKHASLCYRVTLIVVNDFAANRIGSLKNSTQPRSFHARKLHAANYTRICEKFQTRNETSAIYRQLVFHFHF